jgi:two-component system response regulator YesN
VVGAVADGVEALQRIREAPPDAVLTDIKMPNMDGLELIGEIRKISPRVEVVILSGYEDFEFARRGLQLGAFAYILKIELKQELPKVFRALGRRLAERKSFDRERASLMRLKDDRRIDELSEGRTNDLLTENAYTFIAGLRQADGMTGETDRVRFLLAGAGIPCRLLSSGAWKAIVQGRDGTAVLERCEAVLRALRRGDDSSARPGLEQETTPVGVGLIASEPAALPESCRTAMEALDYGLLTGRTGLVRYDHIRPLLGSAPDMDHWLEIAKLILLGRRGEIASRIQADIDQTIRSVDSGIAQVRLGAESVCSQLLTAAAPEDKRLRQAVSEAADDIATTPLLSLLRDRLIRSLVQLADEFEHRREFAGSHRIEKAKEFLDRNYATNILLEDVAEYVYWSPSYFASQFKLATGMTFSEYLRNRRIGAACEMLAGPALKIREVAQAVGFTDVKYFMRVFKKVTGRTPNQYRNSLSR